MNTALDQAFTSAERSYTLAKAATSKETTGRSLAPSASISAPYSSPDLGRHQAQYAAFCDWVFTGVRAIAQRVAGQNVCVARKSKSPRARRGMTDELQPLPTHELLSAIDDPNELMVRWTLLYVSAANLTLTGKSYWWLKPSKREGHTLDIWPLPSHWVRSTDPDNATWKILPEGSETHSFDVPGEDIAYFSYPDPSNPFRAKSPVSAQARAVELDQQIQDSQGSCFRRGIHPTHAIIVGKDEVDGGRPMLSKEDREALITAIRQRYSGVAKHGEPLILDALIEDVKQISTSPSEMDWLNSSNVVKSRIMQGLGVNPIIVGEVEGANRASAVVAEEHFCRSVVNPLLELMSQVLTAWVAPRFGDDLIVWIEPCSPNDVEMTQKQWEAGLKVGAVTRNEYRARVLGLEPIDGLDQILEPALSIPRA